MANNHFEMNGVLVLGKVTPVIKALFGGFSLDEKFPGNGEVYIMTHSEGTGVSWNSLQETLAELVHELNILPPDEDTFGVDGQLQLLGKHFNVDEVIMKELLGDIPKDPDESVDVDIMFDWALAFNDGHNLTCMKLDGAYTCDKPRLFEFGGVGAFTGTEYQYSQGSAEAMRFGEDMQKALEKTNIGEALNCLQGRIQQMLSGIFKEEKRRMIIELIKDLEFK